MADATTPVPVVTRAPSPGRRQALAVLVASLAGAAGAAALKPTHRLAEDKPALDLARQVPSTFGDWRDDPTVMPLVPNPELQAKLDSLYSQTLARTYINRDGARIMLSVAYGSDQSSEATSVHRPEFCYSAQGFKVRDAGVVALSLPGKRLVTQRLVARMSQRHEPISYWITLDTEAALPGWQRKLHQLQYGLRGQIPDGMLVRVSTVGLSDAESFALQQAFLVQLYGAMDPSLRARFFGA